MWLNRPRSAGELSHFIDFFQRATSLPCIAAEQKYRTCKQLSNCALIWSHAHHPNLEIKGGIGKNVKNDSTLLHVPYIDGIFR